MTAYTAAATSVRTSRLIVVCEIPRTAGRPGMTPSNGQARIAVDGARGTRLDEKDLRRLGEDAASDHRDRKQRRRQGNERGAGAGGHIGARRHHDATQPAVMVALSWMSPPDVDLSKRRATDRSRKTVNRNIVASGTFAIVGNPTVCTPTHTLCASPDNGVGSASSVLPAG
jgi:hypothetical protein